MPNDPRKIIIDILNIIGYMNNKNVYADRFFDLALQKATLRVMQSLSKEKQEQLKNELKTAKTPDELIKLMTNYVDKTQFEKHLEDYIEKMFIEFIDSITPTLDPEQKTKLDAYLKTLSPENPRIV